MVGGGIVSKAKAYWRTISTAGVWVAGIVLSFLAPPPIGAYELYDEMLVRFVQFLITIVAGGVIVLALRFNRPTDALWWFVAFCLSLLIGVGCFLAYFYFSDAYTCIYNSAPVVIGSQHGYTDFAKAYLTKNPGLSNEELINHFAGQLNEIWDHDDISQRRFRLSTLYAMTVPFFVIAIIAIVQAYALYLKKPKQPGKNRSA
jgi:hypothetical protein